MNEISEDSQVERQLRRLTVDEYYRMAEAGIFDPDERIELVEGAIIRMVPHSEQHAAVIVRLSADLFKALSGPFEVRVQLPLTVSDYSDPEPDFAVVRAGKGKTPRHRRSGHPRTALLVIEIARSSQKLDRQKAGLYASAGVAEYWIINLRDRCVEVFRRPDRAAGRYRSLTVVEPGERLKPAALPGPEVALDHLFR